VSRVDWGPLPFLIEVPKGPPGIGWWGGRLNLRILQGWCPTLPARHPGEPGRGGRPAPHWLWFHRDHRRPARGEEGWEPSRPSPRAGRSGQGPRRTVHPSAPSTPIVCELALPRPTVVHPRTLLWAPHLAPCNLSIWGVFTWVVRPWPNPVRRSSRFGTVGVSAYSTVCVRARRTPKVVALCGKPRRPD